MDRLRLTGLGLALAEQPSNTTGSAQLSSSGSSACGSTACAFSPASSISAPKTLAYALPRLHRALKIALRICAISDRNARASRGGCVETNSSTAGR